MSNYEEEILNYLMKKDNFTSAYEIYHQFPEVRKKLIELFWEDVKKYLAEKMSWEIKISQHIFETYSTLKVFVDKSFAVTYEKLHERTYYGLWIDKENENLNRQKIDGFAKNIKALSSMKSSDSWLGYTYAGPNFNRLETLLRLLPDSREDYAHELANQLFELTEELKDDIQKMSQMIIR